MASPCKRRRYIGSRGRVIADKWRPRHRSHGLPGRVLRLHRQSARPHQGQRGEAGTGGGQIRRPALWRPPHLGQDQAGTQAPAPRGRYTAKRLDATCRRSLDVDLIDVRRLKRILVQAWSRMTYPNCRHPSQPVVSPGPAPSAPMLMPKEVSNDPRH